MAEAVVVIQTLRWGASPVSSSRAVIKRRWPEVSPGCLLWKIEET